MRATVGSFLCACTTLLLRDVKAVGHIHSAFRCMRGRTFAREPPRAGTPISRNFTLFHAKCLKYLKNKVFWRLSFTEFHAFSRCPPCHVALPFLDEVQQTSQKLLPRLIFLPAIRWIWPETRYYRSAAPETCYIPALNSASQLYFSKARAPGCVAPRIYGDAAECYFNKYI